MTKDELRDVLEETNRGYDRINEINLQLSKLEAHVIGPDGKNGIRSKLNELIDRFEDHVKSDQALRDTISKIITAGKTEKEALENKYKRYTLTVGIISSIAVIATAMLAIFK
jgi:archaellum component FlaC